MTAHCFILLYSTQILLKIANGRAVKKTTTACRF